MLPRIVFVALVVAAVAGGIYAFTASRSHGMSTSAVSEETATFLRDHVPNTTADPATCVSEGSGRWSCVAVTRNTQTNQAADVRVSVVCDTTNCIYQVVAASPR